MTIEPKEYRTGIATLKVVHPQLIEIHYHPGIKFNLPAIAEVQVMRRALMGTRPYATLTIIPEDVDYDMDTMSVDQGQADRAESQLLAIAVVAKASMIGMLTRLYFSNFPALPRVLVTQHEQVARDWIASKLEEGSATAG